MTGPAHDEHFEQVVRANGADLMKYFQRRTSDGGDAADAFGELLLTAWRQRRRLPLDDTGARLWLFGVARNVHRNSRRALARRSAAVQRFVEEMRLRAHPTEDPRTAELREAISELPEGDAELIRLIYWDGLNSHEAAQVVGINPSTARSRLVSARQRLRLALSPSTDPAAQNPAAAESR